MWERNAVLAEAFCDSDERVRIAQTLLDEAVADRSRCLAGFSITVGSDGAVAQMLGLGEREVRVARRTVGKEDARTVADALLARVNPGQGAEQKRPGPASAEPHLAEAPASAAEGSSSEGPVPDWDPPPVVIPAQPSRVETPPQLPNVPTWSPVLDAVLVGAWHSRLDLTAVAAEFGMDIAQLTLRAQQLSAEGRLTDSAPNEDHAGRHRRGRLTEQEPRYQQPAQTPRAQPDPGSAWQQWQWQQTAAPPWASSDITAAGHDWDGILDQWQTTPQSPM